MNNFTKGPWTSNTIEVRAQSSIILFKMYDHSEVNMAFKEKVANAKLAASAPEMLELLIKIKIDLSKHWTKEEWIEFDNEMNFSEIIKKAIL